MMRVGNKPLLMWQKHWSNWIKYFFPCVLILLGLVSCSSNTIQYKDKQSDLSVINKIESQHRVWRNTPYRYGGNTLKGVDCSGFVMNFYNTKMNRSIPRSTSAQAKIGRDVSTFVAGDLIFFKTGKGNTGLHVGIYYKDGLFLHASTTKGVHYASLHNRYWKDRFWMARRVI